MIPGFHNILQYVQYDLLDDPEAGFLVVIKTPSKDAIAWRNTPVPPVQKGWTRTNLELITILLRPEGNQSHSVKVKAAMDLHLPRWILKNSVARWVLNRIARSVYGQVMRQLANFESTEFATRMARDRAYFERISTRLSECQTSQGCAGAPRRRTRAGVWNFFFAR